ncbi:unnamed protein product [Parajaminaea phylloscopi]
MSFSWKGLLGVGSGSSSSSASQSGPSNLWSGLHGNAAKADRGSSLPTSPGEDLEEDAPLWGIENFGNTCYANSVLQALYSCKPFRDAILSQPSVAQAGDAIKVSVLDPPHTEASSNGKPSGSAAAPSRPGPPGQRTQSSHGNVATDSAGPSTQAEKEPDTVLLTLHQLFASIGEASSRHLSSQDATGSSTPSGAAASKIGLTGRGGKGAKAGSKAAPSRPSTAMSSMTVSGSAAGKRRDPGVGAGSVDASVVKAFLAAVRRENQLFDTNAHQDAHEFLNILLNQLGDDLTSTQRPGPSRALSQSQSEGDKTLIHDLFEGVLTNETRCLTCEAISSRDECFLDLSIDIEHNSSITSCLRQFSASETLRSRNKFFCDTCSGLQEAEKRMKVRKLPSVLALHMKRFKFEESTQRFVKLAYRVLFPLELRLFNTADDAEDPDRLYELFGIVVHIGAGPHHGHYVSILKVGAKWAVFDDETVTFIEQLDISKYFGGVPGMGSAYVLFYQAADLESQDSRQVDDTAEPVPAKEAPQAPVTGPTLGHPSETTAPTVYVRSPANSFSSSTRGVELPGTSPLRPQTSNSSRAMSGKSSTDGAHGGGSGGGTGFFTRRRGESIGVSQAVEGHVNGVDAAGKSGGWKSTFRSKASKRSDSVSESRSPMAVELPAKGANSPVAEASHLKHSVSPSLDARHLAGPSAFGAERTEKSTNSVNSAGNISMSQDTQQKDVAAPSSPAEPAHSPHVLAEEHRDRAVEEATEPRGHGRSDAGADPASHHLVPHSDAQSPVGRTAHVESDRPEHTKTSPRQSPQRRSTLPHSLAPVVIPTPIAVNGGGPEVSPTVTASPQMVQTGTFAPMWDRPLSKKEQQKIAKTARRISVSKGLPAGFDSAVKGGGTSHAASNGHAAPSQTSPVSSTAKSGIGKGLPVSLIGETSSPTASSAPKRRSTLSKAFGIGFGSGKKDKAQ